ncbi:MAG: hypothetical protein QG570_90 [Patescibacteria group bacterium]|nr:hypothetical protein [Patescibacteria group bacterium]
MITNEPTATISSVSEEVQKAFQASGLISELGHFAGETQYLLAIHEELNSEPKESLEGNDSPEASGWRVLPKQLGSDSVMDLGIKNTRKNSEGAETAYVFMPFYGTNLSSKRVGVTGRNVVGACYMIEQEDAHKEYSNSTQFSYFFDEENPSMVVVTMGIFRLNTRSASFRLRIDLRKGELLHYIGSRWGKNRPLEDASINELIHFFSRFQDKWLPLEK